MTKKEFEFANKKILEAELDGKIHIYTEEDDRLFMERLMKFVEDHRNANEKEEE